MNSIPMRALHVACALLVSAVPALLPTPAAAADCVPVAGWVTLDAAGAHPAAGSELMARLARQSAVLLGESHDSVEDHRWQLQTVSALHALRPNMVLGFEMFPRRVQPVLDRWVAGQLSEAEFLSAVEWRRIWNVDPQLYAPLLHFARMNRIPMAALNIDQETVRAVRSKGLEGVPADTLEGVTRPAAPSDAYLDFLLPIFREHDKQAGGKSVERSDPAFRRFVDSQQLWDRALAQGIAAAAARPNAPLVVAILGKGHVLRGFGVPHQLKDLKLVQVAGLVTWERTEDCKQLAAGYADAVFGIAAPASAAAQRPRLGIQIDAAHDGVRVLQVTKGSIAEAAGMREGDIVAEAAGAPVKQVTDLIATVQRQAPGTWLPLKVRRGNETLDIVAKFPPAAP